MVPLVLSGRHGLYHWIETHDLGLSLYDLINSCPSVVDGRYLALLSMQGQPLTVTAPPFDPGWSTAHAVAISPQIRPSLWIPMGEHDEWYLYGELPHPDLFVSTTIMATQLHLSFQDAHAPTYRENIDPGAMDAMQEQLWSEIERLQPESYIALSTWLLFATVNDQLFREVQQWMLAASG